MNELALFAGAGGGILGGKLLGWRTVCAVEWDPYAASVLAARQNDGLLPPFPIWDDVRTFDGRPWRGVVDVVSGGFPCQDISLAGSGAGIDGERSGLWGEMARIIGEVRPRFAFVENSPALVTRGLGRVLSDLAALGYDCRWTVLGAADVGAPHRRERFWLVATDADREQLRQLPGRQRGARWTAEPAELADDGGARDVADAAGDGRQQGRAEPEGRKGRLAAEQCCTSEAVPDAACAGCAQQGWAGQALPGARPGEFAGPHGGRGDHWLAEPDVGRVADGVAARVDRLKALGNGQVPQCAAEAWRILTHNAELSGGAAVRSNDGLDCFRKENDFER